MSTDYPNIRPSLLLDFANTKKLDPRITFTRTTTATYYDGVTTAKAEQNLLTYSQEFDNAAWSKTDAAVTANATTAPDGTSTADSMIPSATNAEHNINQSINYFSGSIIVSIYAKANGYNYLQINAGFDTSYVNFDITSGSASVTATSGANISGSIQDAGNGWYRCIVTYTPSATGSQPLRFGIVNSGTAARRAAFLANGTSGVYLWGAQLEQRSSVTAYTATTTQAITNYIPVLQTAAAGQARFDHNPITSESLGLLIEEQRTNSLTYSAQFDNAAWTKINATITANTIVAPDGTLTGDKFVEGSGASQLPQVYVNTSISASTAFTLSIYAKAAERNWLVINANDGTQSNRTWFNLSTGVVGTNAAGTTATITPVGNGWYRCTASRSTQSTVPNTPAQVFQVADADGSNIYTGNGFSGLFIWGAQLEISGSFATSYIPTVASTVTRAQDLASMSGANLSSWFNNAQGTLYIDGARFGTNLYPRFAGFYGQNLEDFSIGIGQWTSSSVVFYGVNNSAVQFSISQSPSGLTWGSQIRAAGAYAVNDVGFSANNTVTSVDTNATIPVIDIFYLGNGLNPAINGWLKKVTYYPIRCTNAQLQALTA